MNVLCKNTVAIAGLNLDYLQPLHYNAIPISDNKMAKVKNVRRLMYEHDQVHGG